MEDDTLFYDLRQWRRGSTLTRRHYQCSTVHVMKYYDLVSQYAVNCFLSHCGACASVNDSARIRTDTALDQDCVLKANVHVCTACMVVSLLTTCLNFKKTNLAI